MHLSELENDGIHQRLRQYFSYKYRAFYFALQIHPAFESWLQLSYILDNASGIFDFQLSLNSVELLLRSFQTCHILASFDNPGLAVNDKNYFVDSRYFTGQYSGNETG